MNKIKIYLLTLLFSQQIFAQNQEVVYENIFLVPEKTKEALLVEGVKAHNQEYHSEGETRASLYTVLIGPHSGQYVWLNGPMTLSDYDNFPDEAEHLVALRAAISAAQYKLNFEEDIELYGGILATLKAQYTEGVQAMKAGEITPLQQGK